MPIFFQQEVDADTKLGIWKIEEDETYFDVPLQKEITHPHKRLQHLAGRWLLRYLFPDFPLELVRIADTRKPFLEDEAFHFSISHCGDFAAAIVSRRNRVGVDIELASDKVERIRHKFISANEKAMLDRKEVHLPSVPTLVWSAKEAVFKWYGHGGIDFRGHIEMKTISARDHLFEAVIEFKKNEPLFLALHGQFFDRLCLSYVAT
jgi:phosphopantetheinyl transferase